MPPRKQKTEKSETASAKPVEPVPAKTVEVESEVVEQKVRKVRSRETVLQDINSLSTLIEEEVARLRDGPNKAKGVKFLRTLGKHVKDLQKNAARVLKQKKPTERKNNTNSGFLKPVKISGEMAKFTGWDTKELKSRVDVTKFICNYIKENNLQNPTDKRQINADVKLSKLLKFDSKKDDKPLTYYRIQSYIKPHFVKDEK